MKPCTGCKESNRKKPPVKRITKAQKDAETQSLSALRRMLKTRLTPLDVLAVSAEVLEQHGTRQANALAARLDQIIREYDR